MIYLHVVIECLDIKVKGTKSNDPSVVTTFFIVNSLHCIYKTQIQSNFSRWAEFDVLLIAFNVISLVYVSLTKRKKIYHEDEFSLQC